MLKNVSLAVSVLLFLSSSITAGPAPKTSYNILDFGAKPDGKTLCTEAIQKAVDQCAQNGGGTVYLPAGTWLTGTIYLESHITLQLDSGCVLLGSKEKKDYGRPHKLNDTEGETFSCWAIIAGRNLTNIAIRGRGTIDGQGANFKYKDGPRPKNIYLESCSDVLIEGVRMRSAGSWMQHYRRCDRLTIRDIAVFNHVSYNNDGLNIDSCRNVTITGLPGHAIENVTLSNISLGFEGGGRQDAARDIAEKPESYPESTMFGTLPAYGFFCRHVKGLRFHNLQLQTSASDYRHAVVLDDVNGAILDSLDTPFAAGAAGTVQCTNSQNVVIRNCRPPSGTELFLDLRGPQTGHILLLSNDLARVKEIAHLAADVPESALALQANQLPAK